MSSQVSQAIPKTKYIARHDSISFEALAFMFAGVIGIPVLALGCLFFLVDPDYLRYIESLPKVYGLFYGLAGLASFTVPTILFVYFFPCIARRFFPGSCTLKLYDNGLAVFAHGEEGKFHLFEKFDRILIEQSDDAITLDFLRGEGGWMFRCPKEGNLKRFSRLVHLAASFPQGRPRQGPPREFRSLC